MRNRQGPTDTVRMYLSGTCRFELYRDLCLLDKPEEGFFFRPLAEVFALNRHT